MEKKLLCFSLILSLSFGLFGQWKKVREVSLDQYPSSFACDGNGNLYIGYNDGNLIKYNTEGEELINYALPNLSSISLIEPQFQLKTFLFYYDIQQITLLDRFNSVPKNYFIRDFNVGFASMACPSADGTFWLIENNPTLLRRFKPNKKTIIQETQPKLGEEIRLMRSLQNILLIVDEKGLHIFDQFGTILFFYESSDIYHIGISDNYIYFSAKDHLIKMDPFSGEIIRTFQSPVKETRGVIYTKDTYLILSDKKIHYYQKQ